MPKITYQIHDLGLLMVCSICVHSEYERALKESGRPVPQRVNNLNGLVDTGSDSVLIDSNFAAQLTLPVHSFTRALTVDGQSQRIRSKCEVGLVLITSEQNIGWEGPAYCSDNLSKDCQFDLIIGRNFLESLHLLYDGPDNSFTISHG